MVVVVAAPAARGDMADTQALPHWRTGVVLVGVATEEIAVAEVVVTRIVTWCMYFLYAAVSN